MRRDLYRGAIDVARHHTAPQPLGRGDRQDAAAGTDVERPAKAPAQRDSVECLKATAGRGVLAGAERRRRVDFDCECARRRPALPMRTVDEETPDPQRWKGAAVFREPVALGQPLFDNPNEPAAGGGGGEGKANLQLRIQHRRARIGLDPPQRGALGGLECRYRTGQLVERRGDRKRRIGAFNLGGDPQRAGHQSSSPLLSSRRKPIGAKLKPSFRGADKVCEPGTHVWTAPASQGVLQF